MSVRRGDDNALSLTLTEKPSGLAVTASDERGDDVQGVVYVDGARVGVTPGRFTVGMCTREVEVRRDGYEGFWTRVSLREREVKSVKAVLGGGPARVEVTGHVASDVRVGGGGSVKGMVRVPAGGFKMGSNSVIADESPQ